eukprot:1290187-Prymnesium_polylepis.1
MQLSKLWGAARGCETFWGLCAGSLSLLRLLRIRGVGAFKWCRGTIGAGMQRCGDGGVKSGWRRRRWLGEGARREGRSAALGAM